MRREDPKLVRIAVMITCYNRVGTTTNCLESLAKLTLERNKSVEVYLVDDASPDNTGTIVKEKFPSVHVIEGTGELYWNRGMALAWETARKDEDFDFYLWLNDDVVLEANALETAINDYRYLKETGVESLIVGVLRDPDTGAITYTGYDNDRQIQPKGIPESCDFITGNFVLVSKKIFDEIGGLNPRYTHGIGDTDYGYRAIAKGFRCSTTSAYVGTCRINKKENWSSAEYSLFKRLSLLFDRSNGAITEYLYFVRYHRGYRRMFLSLLHTAVRLFFPTAGKEMRKR